MPTVVIQAVRGRRLAMRAALAAELARQGCCPVVVEAGRDEPVRDTFVRALHSGTGEYVVRLEDDAWPAPDFVVKLDRLLARRSFNVLMLYSNRKAVSEAHAAGKELVRLNYSDLSMSVGLAVSSGVVASFAAYLPSWGLRHPQHKAGQDLALADFCRKERLVVQAVAPSVVQHRDADSYLGHPCGRRKSRTYAAAYGEVPPC